MELVEELQGYTVERLKELCSARGIKVAGKAKDELISLLSSHDQMTSKALSICSSV